jgi:flagellar biosynthesis regulator FlaF
MEQALDPRRWTRAISDVWHRFIPDVQAAFNALKEEALRK